MRRTQNLALVFFALLLLCPPLAGCSVPTVPPLVQPTPTLAPTPTLVLPPADDVAQAFLQAWQQGDFLAMYDQLSYSAQDAFTEQEFVDAYRRVVDEAMILGVTPRILAAYQPGSSAEVTFDVNFQTALVGDFDVQNQMTLNYETDRWGVAWSPTLILPQLSDETFVRLTTRAPSRGNIYDRNGGGLAVQGELVEVGVIPGDIVDEAAMLGQLAAIMGKPAADLQTLYADARADWYVPLGTISAETGQYYYETLTTVPGIELREAWTRSYWPETIAPHLVGLVGPIPEDEVEQWQAQGYSGDEMVGRIGLERWGEPFLIGERGGRLEILSQQGGQVAVLADKPTRESASLYTTFDRDFQKKVQEILSPRLGAIAVVEVDTGRVLALATYPNFDPNLFSAGISDQNWAGLQADGRRPLVNRATQGTYPLGSVFKIVTTASGMEAGGLSAQSSFVCRGSWTGLGPEWPKVCWLTSGHGNIPLNRALTASCDIFYYQVGLLLNGVGQDVLPSYAKDFGFGAMTGLEAEEAAGLVPSPEWKLQTKGEGWAPGDTVNLAIGQGELQVTPLQVAMMLAAVGNGGTLYRPQLVEMIASDPKNPDWVFEPAQVGQIPISEANLAVIQNSLHNVTASPSGTAFRAFEGLSVPVAGKTGTAESGQQDPHAWFAAYAPADDPEIAIVAIVEHSGEGGVHAAPLVRQVVETYYGIDLASDVTPTLGITPTLTITPTASP